MSIANIPFKVCFELGDNNTKNFIKIEKERINFNDLFLKNLYFWFLTFKESFYYLTKGSSIFFLRNFIVSSINTIKFATAISKKFKHNLADYIYCAYFFDDKAVALALLKKKFPEIKVVSRTHGFETYPEQAPFGHIPFQKFKLKYLDKIFPVSKHGAAELKKIDKKYTHKIIANYLGTNYHELLNPYNTKLSIVSCAYVRSIKRLDTVIDILKLIKEPLEWTLIGDGEDLLKIKQKAKELPSNIKVHFLGSLTQKEIFNVYQNNPFTLFLSVSQTEGLPISIMEAISFGIPVIATNVGGCNEIVTNETGILISKELNYSSIAKTILALKDSILNTPESRKNIKEFWKKNFTTIRNYELFKNEIIC